ncbi:hypothetical protein OPV22_032101 [Ensete ventricosum]|uniref:Peptidylprolyl isomerase n=1 Tax=Ensete ventricosum TaxID=4639 RepID=A0AAV8P101_ENSVE|nr:hypothetical protein OPV22_032101 [Ensete ventricosum]
MGARRRTRLRWPSSPRVAQAMRMDDAIIDQWDPKQQIPIKEVIWHRVFVVDHIIRRQKGEVGVWKGEAGGDPSASGITVDCLWLVLVLVKKGIELFVVAWV